MSAKTPLREMAGMNLDKSFVATLPIFLAEVGLRFIYHQMTNSEGNASDHIASYDVFPLLCASSDIKDLLRGKL